MVLETTRFGTLNVDPETVITLPRGLIGFPAARRFVLLGHAPGHPFRWLQSIDDPTLGFVVIDPHLFFPDYDIEISRYESDLLGIRDPEEAMVLTLVTIRSSNQEITTNLLGPLVIGTRSHCGAQLVINGDRYSTRHSLPLAHPAQGNREMQPAA
jgi:flagellar assembly factor FliW